MKNIIKYSIICLLLISSIIINAQDRNVIWVHGILGGQGSWEIYDDMFEQSREMTGKRMDYSDNNDDLRGFSIAATNLAGDINAEFGSAATDPQNIAICHSMGGLVTREMQRQLHNANQPDLFGGFITVGSPHNGAGIASSILNGTADAFSQSACIELSAGPASSMFQSISANGQTINDICTAFQNNLINPLQGIGNNMQSLTDMSPNSTIINQLNTHNNNNVTMPRLAINGWENGPVHWRTISSLSTGTISGTQNMNDELLPNAINVFRNVYIASRTYNNIMSSIYSYIGGFGIGRNYYRRIAGRYNNRAVQWNRGIVWIDNSENQWNTLTGCFQNTTTTITTQTYLAASCNQQFMTGTPAWLNCIIQQCGSLNMSNCWQTTTQTFTTITRDRSDGVVCEASQQGLGGACATLTVNGVNHFEERNTTNGKTNLGNDEMERVFLDVWSGQTGSNTCAFFIVPPR